jgi:hypothetical protein
MEKSWLKKLKTQLLSMKIRKISEIVYLIIFFIATLDYLFGSNDESNRKSLLLFFALISLFMFCFRRYFRKKFENKNK